MGSCANPLDWPSLAEELAPFLKYCQGIVLNAGSGLRSISLGQRALNIDIEACSNPDVIADLHCLPLRDNCVDTVVSLAVLEHTARAWIVAQEFARVLRPGGHAVVAVPFLQPQHACPGDYVRFTENGLIELMRYAGLEVVETATAHHFGRTLAWLLWEYLQETRAWKPLFPLWMFLLRQISKSRFLKGDSPNTHNTHYLVAKKPGEEPEPDELRRQLIGRADPKTWFFPLLECPRSRQPLRAFGDILLSADGRFEYTFVDGMPCFLPRDDIEELRDDSFERAMDCGAHSG